MKFLFTALFTLALSSFFVFTAHAQMLPEPMDAGGGYSAGDTSFPGPNGQGTSFPGPNGQGSSFPNPFGNTSNTNSLSGFVQFALEKIVLPIGAVVVVFFVIYSGYLFVTANGSEDKLEKAKHTFLGVVIGAAILLGSWTIASAIKGTLCEIAPSIPGLCGGSNNL
ncbi:MAG: pilin [Candidatus Paceibacterota bacterium]